MVFGQSTTERNLILTGYVEPNKPRIGRQIAERLRMRFIDVEEQIEQRMGDNIDVIRANYGERRLKSIEDEIIDELILHRQTLIRVNGSTLMHSDNLERLQETGHVLVLVARLGEVLRRLHVTLGARYHDPGERAVAIGELKRQWAVRHKSGVHEINATYQSEEEIVQSVLDVWQEVSIERI